MFFVSYFKSFVMNLGYNLLYLFSYFQIKYKKYLIRNEVEENVFKYEISYWDGCNKLCKKTNNYLEYGAIVDQTICIIIVRNTETGLCFISKIPDLHLAPIEWKVTKYKFIYLAVILEENGKHYDIELINPNDCLHKYNYYVVGNVIDEVFISYYLKEYEGVELKSRQYFLEFMDDDKMIINKIPTGNTLVLLENEVKIISTQIIKNKNKTI